MCVRTVLSGEDATQTDKEVKTSRTLITRMDERTRAGIEMPVTLRMLSLQQESCTMWKDGRKGKTILALQ